jgi:hypothetical protein
VKRPVSASAKEKRLARRYGAAVIGAVVESARIRA